MIREGDLLWTPPPERAAGSVLADFTRRIEQDRGIRFADYESLWRWSVEHLEEFWAALWDYFRIEASAPYERVLGRRAMPGAEWFPGARLNYAQHALRHARPGEDALYFLSEATPLAAMRWDDLGAQVRILATRLRALGIEPGDTVVGYLPNVPQALVAMLATTAIGAVWSGCSPDFGTRSVLDRFSQIAPKLMFCVDGYRYGGKPFDRRAEVARIAGALDSLRQVVWLPYLDADARPPVEGALRWDALLDHPAVVPEEFRFEQVAFDHPLWILFSSGTTGLPKPIVHGHGGIILEQLKLQGLHLDLRAGDRMFFFTTTGWMMWNFVASALLLGASPLLYDGNPAWPEPGVLWRMVQDARARLFGASPTYVQIMAQQGVVPKERFDLADLRTVMLAGSPVSPECMAWFYRNVKSDLWVISGSGGTDVCSGFVGGVATAPVRAGEIQGRHLGVDAHAYDEAGRPVIDEVGELVIRQPMPSMPVRFWNDPDGARYRASYFECYPGVWRHGDFFKLNDRGACFVLGRSDATLNRHGVRIGTAEIYRAVESLPEVEDAIVVNLDLPGGRFFMPLFVKLGPGLTLDDALDRKIRDKLRSDYSPRHVPDRIYAVDAVPYTLTGKKMEVPVRRILMGADPDKVASRDAMRDPGALEYFVAFRRTASELLA
jgi:acetoacetyl-CoA synthetase